MYQPFSASTGPSMPFKIANSNPEPEPEKRQYKRKKKQTGTGEKCINTSKKICKDEQNFALRNSKYVETK